MENIFNLKKYAYPLRENDLEIIRQTSETLVDSLLVGGYELYLIRMDQPPFIDFSAGPIYQLAIQREDTSFINTESHKEKQPLKIPINTEEIISKIINKISEWVNKYKKIMVSSFSLSKVKKYLNILKYFGFSIEKDEIYGHPVLWITK